MRLSNAERQQRFRDKFKEAAQTGNALTPEQIVQRRSVAADPLYPIPSVGQELPQFMGWTRYEWSEAPAELADYLGLRQAWDAWQVEKEEMARRSWARPRFSTTRQPLRAFTTVL